MVLKAKRHVDEVLVIDDGSTDSTAEIARLAGATVVRHDKNGGKGKAYQTLWTYARDNGYDRLVVLDGDGQHDADEIPLLLAKLTEADMVIGARWGKKTQMPLWRKAGKRVLDYATAAGSTGAGNGPKVTDSQSGFRAYSKSALISLHPLASGFSVESQLLSDAARKGLQLGEVPIHCRYDVNGSTERPVRHASKVLNDLLIEIGIVHPLLLLGIPGFFILAAGLGMGGFAIYVYQKDGAFALGWVMLSAVSIVVGILGLFAGLLFNILPRSLQFALGHAPPEGKT